MASHGSDNSLCLGGGELSGLSSQEGSLRLLLLPLLPDGSKKRRWVKLFIVKVVYKNCVSPIALCMFGIPSLLLLMRFLPFFPYADLCKSRIGYMVLWSLRLICKIKNLIQDANSAGFEHSVWSHWKKTAVDVSSHRTKTALITNCGWWWNSSENKSVNNSVSLLTEKENYWLSFWGLNCIISC